MSITLEKNGATYFRTQNPFEKNFGFSRAVRKGPFIFVGGTTSFDPESGEMMHADSAYGQAKVIFETIIKSVEALGGKKTDILKLKLFTTTMECGMEVGKAFKEIFEEIHPAAILILGVTLASPDMKLEVEAEAVVL
ncbi:YjgF-like protein [Lentinula novae-zelandiae]|uniref:YjgF-like protein n=2 Tax=Lentinula TaxID=5352 RepID=A0ACC1UAE8_9AGAR|nr:YjgF-like protein [Lentinula aff. lateritia]KAJ3856133.1 YjgF-like protein [Lentinula lateritia]KAJ3862825.1 YjgF-like protein [Lentinula novae-zelandiae]KAJ4501210.1 YjgF-like protein [Lentinula lateritia]